ncbi:MAG: ferredoxin [Candidatus Dependentiae bacterium]|nr:ferredoxin [Candidatus Dependentiae bacterium]
MKKVWIAPGCITCGRCEFIAPEVFEVLDVAYVKKDADLVKNEKDILEAVATCPVNVINYNSDNKSTDKSG